MVDYDQTGGLPAATENTAALRPGAKGNVSVGGLKNVSLEGAQSSDIRERLMQMIAERERGNPMQEALGHLALAGSAPGEFSRNYSDYLTRKRQQEQDLLGMRVSAAQLASEETRLKQAAANKKAFLEQVAAAAGMQPQQPQMQTTVSPAQREMPDVPDWDRQSVSFPAQFNPSNPMQGAPGALPSGAQQQGGSLPYRPGALNANQALMIGNLFEQDPKEASKQFLTLTNPSETERTALAAGLSPNTPEWDAHMRLKLAGSGAYVPHNVRTGQGTVQGTPLQAVMGSRAPAVNAPQPMGAAQAPAPQPMGAAQAPAPQPMGAAQAPSPTVTGFAPGSEEDLALRRREIELQQDIRKNAATQQTEKIDVPEQVNLRAKVAAAPDNMMLAKSLINDVVANKDLFGKLREPTVWSSVANLIDKGVQVGQYGSVSIPGVKDFVQQLDPQASKDPKRLDAWSRVLTNMAKIKLNYAKVMLEGQGAVSDNERNLIEQAVGDPSRDSAANMVLKAKAVELEALNAIEKNRLWEQNRNKMTWSQFTSSPQYRQQQRLQYYRTAKELRIQNPTPYPGDE